MNKTNTFRPLIALIAIVAVTFIACKKNSSSEFSAVGQQTVSLYMTDAPVAYDQVLIDLKSVQVLIDTSKNTRKNDTCNFERMGDDHHNRRRENKDSALVWEDLGVSAGIYDILKLRNGVDTLLANKTVVNGAIRMIKLELGTQNSVMVDSVVYPLQLPATANPYVLVKLKGDELDEYLPRKSRLWLDFDLANSIIKEKNGQYYLRPYFKPFVVKNTASITGVIAPADAKATVTVYNATDSAFAIPNRDGKFKLRGLKEGSYTVVINSTNGYASKMINNVVVKTTKEAELGVITLTK
jgi:hypothetical protein